ncbi:MAG: DcaP family trimeric outer membrane transporter, partial [Thermoanaerobaculaceae bacterium]|nr:DcaP family trimeric outer membrane transporter [Thermoanaerobaculaceae bacterium]
MLLGLIMLSATQVHAQAPQHAPPPTPEVSPPVTEPTSTQHLRDLIEQQRKQIEAQEKLLKAQQEQLEAMRQTMESLNRRLQELEAREGETATAKDLAERLAKVESSVQERPELPPEVVSAGNFPGSFRIPGSDAAIKIGGMVWTSLIQTMDALGSDDRFLTYSIPVEGTAEAGKGSRLSLWAGPSRFNFDVRTPTAVGQMRAFIEGDFAGDGKTFRLRHAYGQFRDLIIGHTWSTFSDPDADHWDIDLEGVNAENVQRQAQIRWRRTLREGLRLSLAIEYPTASITGGQAINQVPDLVGKLVWQLPRNGHLQTSAV